MNKNGLSSEEALKFGLGRNVLTPPESVSWIEMLIEKFNDPIIIILIIADVFSAITSIIQGEPLWESLAILVAIVVTVGVSFFQDWSAKKQFDSLNKVSDDEMIKVVRDGSVTEVPKKDLCEGDLVLLNTGDEVPADLILIESNELSIDESTMTGESVPVHKSVDEEGNPTIPSNVVLRSTKVAEGYGKGIVTAVGDETEIGKTTRQATEMTDEKTPLTIQLEKLASKISKLSFWIAGSLLLFLNIQHFLFTDFNPDLLSIVSKELEFVMTSVVLICAIVPEGLPLSSVLALAYSVKAMMKDNNLVKKMKATETVGAVDIIFTDKTGTLTKNEMKVTSSIIINEGRFYLNAAVNSTANLEGDKVIGNPTEGAILKYINEMNGSNSYYQDVRKESDIRSVKPFNSTDKYMSTTISDQESSVRRGKYKDLTLIKGAPEIIRGMIKNKSSMDMNKISEMSGNGYRAISFASGEKEFTYDGTVFLIDPVRDDVPDAISKCYNAGVDVIMMTGDNSLTAGEIANKAGFNRRLTNNIDYKNWVIEAKDFDSVAWGDPHCGYPNVIARCKPDDKLRIMKQFQELGYICAMTGDGANDSSSLNHADVGFSMGSGTSVAKEASDIVLLDNSFSSIAKGIKWGRSLYKNIQSFLTFQLTVNVALCLTALVSPLLGIESPFSVIEILYINLVMDALGALALASEPAMDQVMNDKPRNKKEFIINREMINRIAGTGVSLFISMVFVILNLKNEWRIVDINSTGIFAMFMTVNWMNLFMARSFGKGINPFDGLLRNKLFIMVSLAILVMNVGIVQLGGSIFGTESLDLMHWIEVGVMSMITMMLSEILYRVAKRIKK